MRTPVISTRPPRGRSGNAAMEFGLIALPLVTLIFGIIEFSQYLWYQQTLEQAAAVASQYVYANSTEPVATIEAAIPGQAQGALAGLNSAQLTVTTTSKTDANNVAFITIDLTYPFTYLGIVGVSPLTTTVTASATVPVQ